MSAVSTIATLLPADMPPLPMRAGALPLADVIDLYMRCYIGRDSTRVSRLAWWRDRVGHVTLQDLSDDHVHQALEDLASRPAKVFAGRDAAGRRLYNFKKRPVAPATVNRYAAALAAVVSWAVKKRIAPKGYVHPCRSVERRPEGNGRTRFLSEDEAKRLLVACRAASWPRLFVLVLMALTTGARRGELTGLRWRDVDLEQALATLPRTKNSDPRVLPLVPAVVDELCKFKGGGDALVFASPRDPARVFSFEGQWQKAMRDAGVKHAVMHTLRHTAASMLAQQGASLLEIADVLGHRQMQMVKRYAHHSTGHKAALVTRVLGKFGR